MSRRNQKTRQKPSSPPPRVASPPPRVASPGETGLKAFRAGNYTEAIRLWNEIGAEAASAPHTAIAEAYFRRALAAHAQPNDSIADLRQAVDRMPEEARYRYHLGLMLHRANHAEDAKQAYARAADLGLKRRGSDLTRALAELEVNPACPLETLSWLSPESRAALEPIAALLGNRPQAAAAHFADSNAPLVSGLAEPTFALWRGLALLAAGDAAGAVDALAPPKGQRLPIGAESVRAFYQGVAAALSGNTQAAFAGWKGMTTPASGAQSSSTPQAEAYISRVTAQSVAALLKEERWEEALDRTQAGLKLAPGDRWMLQATLIAANRLAQSAREQGKWEDAAAYWRLMRGILEAHSGLGALPPILHNLAVAYEAQEEWEDAAQTWAALLGAMTRRGRASKKSADTPGSDLPEKQRAWLRRRILDNYKRADLPDEAITYFKQAVKSEPENLEQRLELASALFANDQTVAARNEIQRILDRDPKHIGAFLLQAHIHEERGEYDAAEQTMRRILEIDPKHDIALRGISHLLLEQGMNAYNSRQFVRAKQIYSEALQYVPDDVQIMAFLGEAEIALGNKQAGHAHFETALATGKPPAYMQVFIYWARQQNEAEARNVLARAEAAEIATPMLRIDIGVACLTRVDPPDPLGSFNPFLPGRPPKKTKSKAPSFWETWGRELIQQGLDAAPNRAEALDHLVGALGPAHPKLAIEYSRQGIALQPDNAEIYIPLALLQGISGDIAGAKTTLTQAERLARKQNRPDLLESIAELRGEIDSPMFGMLGSMLASDPDLLDEIF